jgi:hypothetical protein
VRAAVVYFPGSKKKEMTEISRSLARGIESQGFSVDLIDGERDVNTKLTIYNYLALGAVAINFFGGKIDPAVSRFLANSGMVAGKRCFAFTLKKGLRNGKTLRVLMQTMEHEGMFIKLSDVFRLPEEAEAIGKKLHLE